MTIVFQHLRDTHNIGDRWCSPFDWFDWADGITVRDIRKKGAPYRLGIYGGGKIFGGLSAFHGVLDAPGTRHIAWGVSTVQNFPISRKYYKARKLCSLVGSRDWGDKRYIWVPCASCMAPQFDAPKQPEHDIVFYYHAGKTEEQGIKIPSHVPSLSNNTDTIEEALAFIASGKTIVSNSYHGVYWGLLMGRKVVCIPFSRKFSAYRLPPTYAKPKAWFSMVKEAHSQPDLLRLCRVATQEFHKRVAAEIAAVR